MTAEGMVAGGKMPTNMEESSVVVMLSDIPQAFSSKAKWINCRGKGKYTQSSSKSEAQGF